MIDSDNKKEIQKFALEEHGLKLHGAMSAKNMKTKIKELEEKSDAVQETQEIQQQAPKEETVLAPETKRESADSLANRIWKGQSDSLPKHERKRRIVKALVDKGYSETEINSVGLPE